MLLEVLAVVFVVYLFGSMIRLIMDNRSPQSTWAWLLTFIFFPVIGLVVYMFVGRSWKAFSKHTTLERQFIGRNLTERLKPLVEQQTSIIERLRTDKSPSYRKRLLELLMKNSRSVLTTNNDVQILQDAKEKYPCLMQDLQNAKHSIHMQYYILASDEFTEHVKAILIEKEKAGVEVRILYDYLGSMTALSNKFIKELRDAGAEIHSYLYNSSQIHNLSYRNHRKIVVIDGIIGYTGGMNLGKEHLDGGKHFSAWRDTHVRIEGEAVSVLQGIFMVEWYNTTGVKLPQERHLAYSSATKTKTPVQIVPSGPDSEWASIRQLYFFMILVAEKSVYIQSPFFILDEITSEAIRAAALSGVDVKIIIAPTGGGKGLFNMPYDAANTYCKDVSKAGAKVYFYPTEKGYFHPKTICIDSALCSIGTANMDIRSFSINYEVNVVLYDEKLAQELEADFMKDLEGCTQFDVEEYRQRPVLSRFKDSAYRLFSPLL